MSCVLGSSDIPLLSLAGLGQACANLAQIKLIKLELKQKYRISVKLA